MWSTTAAAVAKTDPWIGVPEGTWLVRSGDPVHELVAAGSGADKTDGHADLGLEKIEIPPGGLGKIGGLGALGEVDVPSGQALVDRAAASEIVGASRRIGKPPPVEL